MIRIFYGEDRIAIEREIRRLFGDDFETVEAESLSKEDLDSVFLGSSLFFSERKIVVKNMGENKECFSQLERYLDAPNEVILWEMGFDKRSAPMKALAADKRVELKELKQVEAERVDPFFNFKIFDTAYRGEVRKALKMCAEVEAEAAPQLVLGAWTTSACRNLARGASPHARRALKILAETDVKMKGSAELDAWTLLKAALVKIGTR